jgi:plasmid stabilization system protein ParE
MKEVIWTNFAISELKNIYLSYKMAAGKAVAEKIQKSIFAATRPLSKNPLIGPIEENLIGILQQHRYIVAGNYKIIYFVDKSGVYIVDIFDCRRNPQKMRRNVNK